MFCGFIARLLREHAYCRAASHDTAITSEFRNLRGPQYEEERDPLILQPTPSVPGFEEKQNVENRARFS